MTQPAQPIRLHGFQLSGHSHRVELFLNLLGLPYQFIAVNLAGGEHLQPEFLSLNPFGQVPVIEDGAVTLADSNAILVYLAQVYDPARRWLPADPLRQAQIQRWLSGGGWRPGFWAGTGPYHPPVQAARRHGSGSGGCAPPAAKTGSTAWRQ